MDGYAELLLIGELDIAAAPILHATLERLVDEGHRDVYLNLSALTFLDVAGLRALTLARSRLGALGGSMSVTAVPSIPLRVLTMCGMLDALTAGDGSSTPESAAASSPETAAPV